MGMYVCGHGGWWVGVEEREESGELRMLSVSPPPLLGTNGQG